MLTYELVIRAPRVYAVSRDGVLIGYVRRVGSKWRHDRDRHPWAAFESRASAATALANMADAHADDA